MVGIEIYTAALRRIRASLAGGGFFPRRLARTPALRLQVREQRGDVGRAQSQVGHANILVLLEQSGGDWAPSVQHLLPAHDATPKPPALPPRPHPQHPTPHSLALP